jgi:Glycosyl transferases group 1
LRIGCLYWARDDGWSRPLVRVINALGHTAVPFSPHDEIDLSLDAIFIIGPFGPVYPIVSQLKGKTLPHRPKLVLWQTEQFPSPKLPEAWRLNLGWLRSKLERSVNGTMNSAAGQSRLHPVFEKGLRYRYYGDIHWLRKQNLLDVFVVESEWWCQYLRVRGFTPLVENFGYQVECGEDLHHQRDIPVLWLGKMGTPRRARLISEIQTRLAEREIKMLMIDGIENPYLFGDERTKLLNRTRVMLNILREDWDDNSSRFFLAAPNKALIVSEPLLPHTPFIPGVHLVEASIENIPRVIEYYINHDAERDAVTARAFDLVVNRLTLEKAVVNILDALSGKPRPA